MHMSSLRHDTVNVCSIGQFVGNLFRNIDKCMLETSPRLFIDGTTVSKMDLLTFLTGMTQMMASKMSASIKSFRTFITFEWTYTGMDFWKEISIHCLTKTPICNSLICPFIADLVLNDLPHVSHTCFRS